MTPENADAHDRAIQDQFSRQATGFAGANVDFGFNMTLALFVRTMAK